MFWRMSPVKIGEAPTMPRSCCCNKRAESASRARRQTRILFSGSVLDRDQFSTCEGIAALLD